MHTCGEETHVFMGQSKHIDTWMSTFNIGTFSSQVGCRSQEKNFDLCKEKDKKKYISYYLVDVEFWTNIP